MPYCPVEKIEEKEVGVFPTSPEKTRRKIGFMATYFYFVLLFLAIILIKGGPTNVDITINPLKTVAVILKAIVVAKKFYHIRKLDTIS